jgi:hypothetical protein
MVIPPVKDMGRGVVDLLEVSFTSLTKKYQGNPPPLNTPPAKLSFISVTEYCEIRKKKPRDL